MKLTLATILISLFAFFLLVYLRLIIKRKVYRLLPSYLRWLSEDKRHSKVRPAKSHIIFLIVDHFEPGSKKQTVKEWVDKYPLVADKHSDSEGNPPKHTFFYPSERAAERIEHLEMLAELSSRGYGEVELHLHHRDDTDESLRKKIRGGVEIFNKTGALITVDGKVTFGFIHGDWALDNSRMENNRNLCGVNNEISILRDEGCYADFTFPALYTDAQPEKMNSIYYAVDDPDKPKSYNTGLDVTVNKPSNAGDLMIIQGPTTINFKNLKTYFLLRAVSCGIEGRVSNVEAAVDEWIRANIHIKGRPEWVFVKIHTHGAIPANKEFFLGDYVERIYTHLETKYNDGKNFCLHYVSAREAYNIIKAAEAGKSGNPGQYRDFLIKPYLNTVRRSGTA